MAELEAEGYAWGYNPLDQINRGTVNQLQLAWSWAMDDTGANQATPPVYSTDA